MQEIVKILISKGRVTLWVLIVAIVILALWSQVSADKAIEAIIGLGTLALAGEVGARIPGEKD